MFIGIETMWVFAERYIIFLRVDSVRDSLTRDFLSGRLRPIGALIQPSHATLGATMPLLGVTVTARRSGVSRLTIAVFLGSTQP